MKRDKLIELLNEATEKIKDLAGGLNDNDGNGVRADHLIANGVYIFEPCDAKPNDNWKFTNADRIRAMRDEELAEYLASLFEDTRAGIAYSDDDGRWLDWLQQPAKEN